MRLVIEQDDSKPHYVHQKGYTIQLNDGDVHKAAKGSVLAQMIRIVVRLVKLSERVPDWAEL